MFAKSVISLARACVRIAIRVLKPSDRLRGLRHQWPKGRICTAEFVRRALDEIVARHQRASAARRSRRWSSLAPTQGGVEVTIELDPTHRVRATAMGASEMRVRQRRDEVGESE